MTSLSFKKTDFFPKTRIPLGCPRSCTEAQFFSKTGIRNNGPVVGSLAPTAWNDGIRGGRTDCPRRGSNKQSRRTECNSPEHQPGLPTEVFPLEPLPNEARLKHKSTLGVGASIPCPVTTTGSLRKWQLRIGVRWTLLSHRLVVAGPSRTADAPMHGSRTPIVRPAQPKRRPVPPHPQAPAQNPGRGRVGRRHSGNPRC